MSELGSVADIDRALLNLELGLARERGLVGKGAGRDEEIALMQRKGQLGMNAVLSMSLALARLRAAVEGKHLWQVLREEMKRSITRVLDAQGVAASEGEPLSELARKLRAISPRLKEKNVKLTDLFRNAMPVYRPLDDGVDAGLSKNRLSR